ncbi:G1 cyclin Puc1 [Schizosaccharomyces pombe]|uniref:Cyclin puc1 n=1 Tax=Schizosaccharomyces pombe (strain 972 / ATCC 24843) TaxID=284812 RepID=PUC1_SCHPO|nr:cyclin Puc1 [Schizosaccharomyces pombe]P25009.1 RecName: Full=Cyclin puc1 [Schizosaccharomyces pombe 972h-]CAA21817.1 cyclin Puc1 [Schizosaccharomyces pombe]CAA41868.1 puc1 [Schizosaccharomyces pombe]CAA52460.1 cyclin [Schizosaccharomyces pombe]|eukprot:NP_001342772.1 cyclin Puc1 [Schizosaccharomyces pombe]
MLVSSNEEQLTAHTPTSSSSIEPKILAACSYSLSVGPCSLAVSPKGVNSKSPSLKNETAFVVDSVSTLSAESSALLYNTQSSLLTGLSMNGYLGEYQEDIIHHLITREKNFLLNVHLSNQQPELRWSMRPALVNFIVEIHNGFDLSIDTLPLSISLMDSYVSRRVVYCKHIQLVACVCLWIASKFHETEDRVPLLQELKLACKNIYAEDLFIRMERHILDTLDWDISIPTPASYIPVLDPIFFLVLDASMFVPNLFKFPASKIACSVMNIVNEHVGSFLLTHPSMESYRKDDNFLWPEDLDTVTSYMENMSKRYANEECTDLLFSSLGRISSILAKKYPEQCAMAAWCNMTEKDTERTL